MWDYNTFFGKVLWHGQCLMQLMWRDNLEFYDQVYHIFFVISKTRSRYNVGQNVAPNYKLFTCIMYLFLTIQPYYTFHIYLTCFYTSISFRLISNFLFEFLLILQLEKWNVISNFLQISVFQFIFYGKFFPFCQCLLQFKWINEFEFYHSAYFNYLLKCKPVPIN